MLRRVEVERRDLRQHNLTHQSRRLHPTRVIQKRPRFSISWTALGDVGDDHSPGVSEHLEQKLQGCCLAMHFLDGDHLKAGRDRSDAGEGLPVPLGKYPSVRRATWFGVSLGRQIAQCLKTLGRDQKIGGYFSGMRRRQIEIQAVTHPEWCHARPRPKAHHGRQRRDSEVDPPAGAGVFPRSLSHRCFMSRVRSSVPISAKPDGSVALRGAPCRGCYRRCKAETGSAAVRLRRTRAA